TNVAAGSAPTDAVNVSQLQSQAAVVNSLSTSTATGMAALSSSLSATDSRLASLSTSTSTELSALTSGLSLTNSNVASLSTGVANSVQYDDPEHTSVTLGGANVMAPVALKNVAAGVNDTDAVNMSQLSATNRNLENMGSQVAKNAGDITSMQAALSDAVMYDSPAHNSVSLGGANAAAPVALKNVAAGVNDTDAVNVAQLKDAGLIGDNGQMANVLAYDDASKGTLTLSGANGTKIGNVAAGDLSAASTDAVNGSQLYATASSTASALGGGSTVNPDGAISAPSYSVGGTTVRNVGDAIANIDGRVTQNTSDIQNFQNQINNGVIGLVRQDSAGNITVGASTGGMLVSMTGTAGNRVVTGVANGAVNASSGDAVNGSQLYALQNQVTDLNSQLSNLTPTNPYFTASGVQTPADAVVHAANPGSRDGNSATVTNANPNAATDNTVAVGVGAVASGKDSMAIGGQAQASNNNSVALGQGSTTGRDNSVSVGSGNQQRQITNVAAGTADTDAVNVEQLNSTVAQGVQQANSYTDLAVGAMNREIDSVAKKSYAGTAAAMATANLPQAPAPGKSIVAMAGGTYSGQSAVALGLSTFTPKGKWIIKASASTTTGRTFAAGAGAGYVW
ncbi:YadA-like family protein, partial [Paraburkholderia sp. MMS20-SJTR3]